MHVSPGAALVGEEGARGSPSPASAARAERLLAMLLGAGFLLAFTLSGVSLLQITLSADEAWLLTSVCSLAQGGGYETRWGSGPSTTGGAYLLVQWLVCLVAGASKPALRLLPFVSFLLLIWSFARWSRATSIGARLLAASILIALPGTLNLAASAFAAIPATLLLVWGAWLWDSDARPKRSRSVAAGALFGLAAATRINCAVIFPALLLSVLVRGRERRERLPELVLALGVGGALFLAAFAAVHGISPEGSLDLAASSSGLRVDGQDRGPLLEPWIVLQKWGIADGFLPFPLLVAASLVPLFLGRDAGTRRAGLGVLLWFAWIHWVAWLGVAPHPYLRYLWPSLACFALPLGVFLTHVHEIGRTQAQPWLRIAALLIGLGAVLAGSATAVRNLQIGNLNFLEAVWSERMAGVVPIDARALKGQDEMAGYLRRLPAEERIGVIGISWELDFLVGRPLHPLWLFLSTWNQEQLPKRVVVTDHVGMLLRLSPGGLHWLQTQCEIQARFGAFSLYRVVGEYPPPEVLRLRWVVGPGPG
jgi:4-amino-4-deoxy-L-arabinose transferase-like glycosyltransferase